MAADAGSRCAARETLLASTATKRLIEDFVRRPPPSDGRDVPDAVKRLTPRELEVVRAIAHGKSNSEVGAELYLSEPTVPGSIVRRRDRLCATPLNQAAPTFTGKGCIGMRHR